MRFEAKAQFGTAAPQTPLQIADQHIARGNHAKAMEILLPLLQGGALEVDVLDRSATCYYALGDTKTAISLLEFVTQNWPEMGNGWGKLAAMKQTTGDKDGAITCYKQALKFSPKSAALLASLNRLAPFDPKSQKTRRLRALTRSKALSAHELSLAHNALGQIEDKAGKVDRAFHHYAQAKRHSVGEFDRAEIETRVDQQISRFAPAQGATTQGDGPRMIFVCGLPRSGTTLVENILQRHSAVGTIGESTALKDTLQAMRAHSAKRGLGSGYWDWAGQLDAGEIQAFRRYYFERAFQRGPNQDPVVVDKLPLNCLAMGVAQTLLPDAGFIFMSRHPLDVGLSNFATSFAHGNGFSRRLDWFGQMTRQIYRSVWDYQGKLGHRLHMQSFRALVSAPEVEIPALLSNVGLEWQEGCLSPEKSGAAVNTASLLQVREKINTRGLDKWTRFAKHLQPLEEALGGADWLDDWTRRDLAMAAAPAEPELPNAPME